MASRPPISPILITPSPKELREGKLLPQNIERALYALHFDGLVVLENVIDHAHLNMLNEAMVKDTVYLASLGEESPYNYHRGNIQQDPPPRKDLFFRDIFLNDLAIQITSAFLGPRPRMSFLSGNAALKSTESQPVHTDADFAHPQIPFAVVVNVPLITMTPANGATEFWLGTHTISGIHVQEDWHGDKAGGEIRSDILESRRKKCPPIQPIISKGSIVIRDLRLWHCGKPNFEGTTRIMLAMIHFASWYRNSMKFPTLQNLSHVRLEFPRDWADDDCLQHAELEVAWAPTDTEINYIDRKNDYEFDQQDPLEYQELQLLMRI